MKKYKSTNRVKKNNANLDEVAKAMTFAEYYDLMIAPALKFVGDEYAQKLGTAFVKWLAYGKKPHFKQDSDKLLWNALMLACNREFNPIIETMTALEVSKELQQSDKAASSKTCKDSFADRVFREIIK